MSEQQEGARMLRNAVVALAEISMALGIPDDEALSANGNDLILREIRALKAVQKNANDAAVLTELGREMYAMTTTVHSPNIPFAEACAMVPALWQQCMKDRDEALAALAKAAASPIQSA